MLGHFRAEAVPPALQVLFCTNLRSLYLERYEGLELQPRFSDLCKLTVRFQNCPTSCWMILYICFISCVCFSGRMLPSHILVLCA